VRFGRGEWGVVSSITEDVCPAAISCRLPGNAPETRADRHIDDCPETLDKAIAAGAKATGLLMPWNRHASHVLFDSLEDVHRYLSGEMMVERNRVYSPICPFFSLNGG
jgi:hypothetical protein